MSTKFINLFTVKSTAKMYVTQDKRLLHVYLLFLTNNLLFSVLGHKKDVWIVVDPKEN
jgi:hypothetical protein